MGYDMRIRGEVPAAPQHDIEQAKAAYDAATAALKKRVDAGEFKDDIDAHHNAYNESETLWSKWYRLKDPSYFRLNIGGMSRYAGAMLDLGMAHDSTSPVTGDDWGSLPEWDGEDEGETAYNEAVDKLTGQHGTSEDPTIPLHKFGSNDGWLVTPDEIKAALDAWEHRANTGVSTETWSLIQTEYWGEWITWLELAAEHDGFRVH